MILIVDFEITGNNTFICLMIAILWFRNIRGEVWKNQRALWETSGQTKALEGTDKLYKVVVFNFTPEQTRPLEFLKLLYYFKIFYLLLIFMYYLTFFFVCKLCVDLTFLYFYFMNYFFCYLKKSKSTKTKSYRLFNAEILKLFGILPCVCPLWRRKSLGFR